MKMNTSIIKKTAVITELPINQSVGHYSNDNEPCCVGARLAGFLLGKGNFREGLDAFASELGGNRAHVWIMLREAGAGGDPFGNQKWDTDPAKVWENLIEMETLPDLKGADLTGANLIKADLRFANLRKAYLRRAYLRKADLRFANLRKTDLRFADLRKADLRFADLRSANLRYTDLRKADLRKTDLKGADLTGTYLKGAINNI